MADVGLMFIAYNLRRIMNILDKKILTAYLRTLALAYIIAIAKIRVNIKPWNASKYLS